MLVAPARRCRLMARFRSVAITCGPLPVRTWLRSSPNVTSRTQCRRTSMHQWPRSQVASWSGRAWSTVRSVTAYTVSVRHLRLFLLRILRVTWMAWAAWGNRIPSSTVNNFQGAFLDPPVTAVVLGVGDGDVGPGQSGELLAQGGLITFDGEQVMRAALFDEVFRVVFLAMQSIGRDEHPEQFDVVQKC